MNLRVEVNPNINAVYFIVETELNGNTYKYQSRYSFESALKNLTEVIKSSKGGTLIQTVYANV